MVTDGGAERAFVLGLDGVPWGLLSRWVEAGELPNFGRLVSEGTAGPLESTVPATTPVAWPSITTGVYPDKHGLYGFQRLSSRYTKRMHTSRDVEQPRLWNVLSPAQVGNVPITYPAEEIDGELFTGMMTPKLNDRFAHPPELRAELLAEVPEYEIGLNWSEYVDEPEEFGRSLSSLLEKRRRAMRVLMRREDWRLFFFVYTAPDRLQHLVWDEEVLVEHYRELDEIVGEVIEYVDRLNATLYVVSDHGFGALSRYVAVNRALERAGLLAERSDSGARKLFSSVGLSRDIVNDALSKIGISDRQIVDTLPDTLLRSVATQLPGEHSLFDVDYGSTKAFMHGIGSVYVNDTERFDDGIVPPRERDAVKAEAASVLSAVTDPQTGEKPFTVHDGDELYPNDDRSPDLQLESADGYETIKSLEDEVFTDTGGKAANHRKDGIFVARGPNVRAGGVLTGASVVDVAPTLLHDLGEPIPARADGRVLTDVFRAGSPPAERAPETARYAKGETAEEGDDDYDEVVSRLQGLGYME